MEKENSLKDLTKLFLKLGFTAFGGPAAHIGMMQQEVVMKRKWMSEEHFLDLIGATNLIPGPNSTEMAIHIGYERSGWKGLIVAGLCFILPAVCITGIFAWFYKQYGQLPEAQPFIYGIKPAIIAIILSAIYPLAKKSFKTIELMVSGAIILVLSLLGFNEIILMFSAGILALLLKSVRSNTSVKSISPILQIGTASLIQVSNAKLFFIFLKIGSILYGSGYVLFAFLDSELVMNGLLTRQQLIDAIAIGQFTPGPVFSSVTFIGYQMNGIYGAIAATIGIFLPSFIFVALLNPFIPKIRSSKWFSVFLDAINAASIALIIAACYQMGRDSIYDWRTICVALISLIITFRFKKINSAWIVMGSSMVGYMLSLF